MLIKQFVCAWLFILPCLASTVAAKDSSLADAAKIRDFDTVGQLLEQDVDVQATQADGMTALHWAIYHDAVDAARQILKAGANPQAENLYGVTPLSLACQNGDAELVELLLTAGADPNTSLPGGETALMTAARTGRPGPVQQLIASGADVNAQENGGQTALMWAAAEGHTDVVDLLISAGADLNAQLASGFTALFFAVRQGRLGATLRLLDAGSDVNAVMRTRQDIKFGRGRLSTTPLLLAIENGHFELAKALLDAGADPNAQPSGYSALHAVTWVRKPIRGDGDPPPKGSGKYNSLDMVQMLVAAAGAEINARFERGKSELGRFTYTGSTPFLLAAQSSDLPLQKLLVELGADVDLPNEDGATPLLAAAGVGALGDGDESAGTEEETIATVQYLLELGAEINAVDHNGETVMHGAAYQSLASLVPILVEQGANLDVWNHENRAGWTPYIIATGYRPGNFRPAPSTISAIEKAMVDAGAELPDVSKLGLHGRIWTGLSNQNTSWVVKDLPYARVADAPLHVDLHMPLHATDSSLIVWVRGEAGPTGSTEETPLGKLVAAGYTVASVEYRPTSAAPFPAQVHDIKAAIRYLRSLAGRYGYQQDRIAIAGASAGGHLAALVGTTNGVPELEGAIGDHLDQSSDVQAIVDFYGRTDPMESLPPSNQNGLDVLTPASPSMLAGEPSGAPRLSRLASPLDQVDRTDPPLLLIHGDQDPQVLIERSRDLYDQYQAHGLLVHFEVIEGGAHGGSEFYDDERLSVVQTFLEESLRKQ